ASPVPGNVLAARLLGLLAASCRRLQTCCGPCKQHGQGPPPRPHPRAAHLLARLFKLSISSTLGSTTSSTRRFCSRPSSVSLAATGSVSAYPAALQWERSR